MPFFMSIEKLIKKMKLTNDLHWIKVFVAKIPNEDIVVEFLLDNNKYKMGEKELRKFKWLNLDEYYSFRLFIILEKNQKVYNSIPIDCEPFKNL
jgi:hypothetical protein